MATLTANARLGPLARAVIIGHGYSHDAVVISHGYSHGAVNTLMASLNAGAMLLLWPVLRLLAMDIPTVLWQRLWQR